MLPMQLKDLLNYELGSRELIYDERDTILYALAVGADSRHLELVYERDLRALPGYTWNGSYTSLPDHAALYRLTGDLHPIHIDIDVARANGFERPILHGLCTLGIVARELANAVDTHPTRLTELEARLAAPVMPGDTINIAAGKTASGRLSFEAIVNGAPVLTAGQAMFRSC